MGIANQFWCNSFGLLRSLNNFIRAILLATLRHQCCKRALRTHSRRMYVHDRRNRTRFRKDLPQEFFWILQLYQMENKINMYMERNKTDKDYLVANSSFFVLIFFFFFFFCFWTPLDQVIFSYKDVKMCDKYASISHHWIDQIWIKIITGQARLIRSHSSARFAWN